MNHMKIIACLFPCLLFACPPSPVNPILDADAQLPSDAASSVDGAPLPGSPEAACNALKAVGCTEGIDPTCVANLDHALATKISGIITPDSVACMARAITKETARVCPGITCK